MKTCSCGHILQDNELFCSECGKKYEINDATEINDSLKAVSESDAEPLGMIGQLGANINNEEKKPEEVKQPQTIQPPKTQDGDANSIFTMFEKPEDKPKEAKKDIKKPDVPVPSSKIEVKTVPNSAGNSKFNPMKTQPPLDSPFSVLEPVSTAINVFVLLLPVIGVVYAIFLAISSPKKNLKILGISFLSVFLVFCVVIAAAMLVLMFMFEPTFNQICGIIKYMSDTFFTLVKGL